MKNFTTQDVINEYIRVGLILKQTHLSGDYKTGNKELKKIIEIFKILENDIDLAMNSLPLLFNNENAETRNTAAAHCLSLNIYVSEAKNVLKDVKKNEKNIFGFDAKMTLKVWREQGYLKVYPTQVIKPGKID